MAVFTSITFDDLSTWLKQFNLGQLLEFQGISSGVTNTNYLVTTDSNKYILTIFEDTHIEELPFFIDLMAYLANKGLACPEPILNKNKQYLTIIKNKPGLIVSFLSGHEKKEVISNNCFAVGMSLASFHTKAKDFPKVRENSRGLDWINTTFFQLKEYLSEKNIKIIKEEYAFQKEHFKDNLPKGLIHADLFTDNVLFDGDMVSGMIDLYYACTDNYIYDISITINDWCIDDDGEIDSNKIEAFMRGYESIRTLETDEIESLPIYLRFAALRFWVSRLQDFHKARNGEEVTIKDPNHFKNILLKRQEFKHYG